MDSLFPDSYESSRARFLRDVELVRTKWPCSRLEAHPLKNHPDLSIDWLWAEPPKKENLIIVSTAQHGIEGYVGSAMLKIFIAEFVPQINTEDTGLLLIHAINPWGMQRKRKVNENSVDLNRNFILNSNFDQSINPDFSKLNYLLGPTTPVRPFCIENLLFHINVIKALLTKGAVSITHAALLGQYVTQDAIYYGGSHHEEQTTVITGIFREALERYQTIIHLDMHSGYGPRYQMSITVVPLEPLTSAELSERFNFSLVLRGDREEFYATHGDMTGYLYELRNIEFPGKYVFACAFEFGTFGASMLARIRSLRAMVFESQLYRYGASDHKTEEKVRHEFKELYFPAEPEWQEKAIADARQAFDGILQAYNLIGG